MSEPINYINAPVIAKEIGLVVNEKVGEDKGNYTHLLKFEVKTDKDLFLRSSLTAKFQR